MNKREINLLVRQINEGTITDPVIVKLIGIVDDLCKKTDCQCDKMEPYRTKNIAADEDESDE
jgi:hypothetical protein